MQDYHFFYKQYFFLLQQVARAFQPALWHSLERLCYRVSQ